MQAEHSWGLRWGKLYFELIVWLWNNILTKVLSYILLCCVSSYSLSILFITMLAGIIKDLSTISTISGSRNLTISSISGSRNLLVHFCKFWIQKRQYFCGFWIQKSHHFYNIWIHKYFGAFSWFLDPEIAVFLKFLDPETAPFLQFLDCHSITRNWVIIWIWEGSSVTSARYPRFWTQPCISIISTSLDPPSPPDLLT